MANHRVEPFDGFDLERVERTAREPHARFNLLMRDRRESVHADPAPAHEVEGDEVEVFQRLRLGRLLEFLQRIGIALPRRRFEVVASSGPVFGLGREQGFPADILD